MKEKKKINVQIEELEHTMIAHEIEANKAQKVIEDLKKIQEELKAEVGEKKEYRQVGVIIDNGSPELTEQLVYILKVEAGEDHNLIVDKLKKVAQLHNNPQKKTKKFTAIESLADVFNLAKAKHFKEVGLKTSSFEPVLFIKAENSLD